MTAVAESMQQTVRPPDHNLIELRVVYRDPTVYVNSAGLFWASVARAMKDHGFDTGYLNGARSSLIIPSALVPHLPTPTPPWASFSSGTAVCILVHPYQRSKYARLDINLTR